MDIRKLQRAIVDGLEDVKAGNILVFNTEHLSALFERVIIASGTSNRQTKSLAASVRDSVKASGFPVLRTEGENNGEWIIVDCGAAVAHIMQPAIRDYYHLEEIWGDKPVKMKLETRTTRLVKASEEDQDDDDAVPVKKAKAPSSSVRGTASKKAGAKARPLGSTTSRAPAKKAGASEKFTPGTAAGRAAVAAAAAAAGAAGRKAPSRKTAAVKAPPAKKAAPRKSPAAKGAVTRTVGTKGSAPKTEVTRTIVIKTAPGRATAQTSAGRAAITRPGARPAARAGARTEARPAAGRSAAPRKAASKAAGKVASKSAAPRKTATRK